MGSDFALQTRSLAKSFDGRRVVDGVDLSVARGEIVGFLGPNGAGKTTVMNMITGLLQPDSGEIDLLGHRDGFRRPEVRTRIGCLQEKPRIYPEMSARQYLTFFAELYAVRMANGRVDEVLERVGLTSAAGRPLSTFSRGMQQRACLARSLLHGPEFLVLDEPTLGLDPKGVSEMRHILRDLRDSGVTLLFSSHQLDEMERICDSVIFLREGRVIASGKTGALLPAEIDMHSVTVEVFESIAGRAEAVEALPYVAQATEMDTHRLRVEFKVDGTMTERELKASLSSFLAGAGLTVLSITQNRRTLEEFFLELTGPHATSTKKKQLH